MDSATRRIAWLAFWAGQPVTHPQPVGQKNGATPLINHTLCGEQGLFLPISCRSGADVCGSLPTLGLACPICCVELTWRVADHYRPKEGEEGGGSLPFRTLSPSKMTKSRRGRKRGLKGARFHSLVP